LFFERRIPYVKTGHEEARGVRQKGLFAFRNLGLEFQEVQTG